MKSNYEILVLLRHYWKQGFKATESVQKINQIEGEGQVVNRTAQFWFKKFSQGDTSLKRKKGSGRPSKAKTDVISDIVKQNPITTVRKVANELSIPKSTVFDHFKKLGLANKRCREVPHELNLEQCQKRVEICKKLLENPQSFRFFKRIVTCDEKWIYFRNLNSSNQWLPQGEPGLSVVKRGQFDQKAMICVWWNYEGVIHFEIVPNGRSINAALYSDQLERMYAKFKLKYPAIVNRNQTLLQQDNARPHTATLTLEKIQELGGIELLPHPAYSPDLAPSDYHLFRSMAHFLRGRQFNKVNDIEAGCLEFFASKSKEWYRTGIEQLADRWLKTIEHDGFYFET
jgi:histone-lysine N-methyltransferase SETMAR